MSVYVDLAIHPWRGKMWCHLMADSLTELHEFAAKLGLKREWFQPPPKASSPHYDVTESKRVQAVKLGAIELEEREDVIRQIHKMCLAWEKETGEKLKTTAIFDLDSD